MIIDSFGNLLEQGDSVIVTVSDKSNYLTSALILDVDEENKKVYLEYQGTPTRKWVLVDETGILKYVPGELKLEMRVGKIKDCIDRKIEVGSKVYYKIPDQQKIATGTIIEQNEKSPYWFKIDTYPDNWIKNSGIFIYEEN